MHCFYKHLNIIIKIITPQNYYPIKFYENVLFYKIL